MWVYVVACWLVWLTIEPWATRARDRFWARHGIDQDAQ
jgi:hypothetical protein